MAITEQRTIATSADSELKDVSCTNRNRQHHVARVRMLGASMSQQHTISSRARLLHTDVPSETNASCPTCECTYIDGYKCGAIGTLFKHWAACRIFQSSAETRWCWMRNKDQRIGSSTNDLQTRASTIHDVVFALRVFYSQF